MNPRLVLEDKTVFEGKSFGYQGTVTGEVVFATGMTGYPEAFTDPSFAGQILVMTYPLIGNYGVPSPYVWESDRLQISGLIVSTYNETPSHHSSRSTLSEWLKREKIPALEIRDTRFLTKKIRTKGALLGKIAHSAGSGQVNGHDMKFHDPNTDNLVAKVSTKNVYKVGKGKKTVVLIDCGTKRNIVHALANRGVQVIVVPWNFDLSSLKEKYHGLLISNGPGDPTMIPETVDQVREHLKKKIPTFGICLGNQVLALAAGGKTAKLKFGHRGQNQPSILVGTKKCYLTTQNHGYVVSQVPDGFKEWFVNANDNTNEGLMHKSLPFMSVQFHPEATPGPVDTDWLFDFFLKKFI